MNRVYLRQFRCSRTFLPLMGDLVVLSDWKRKNPALGREEAAAPLAFYFDSSCPFSYLAAERVERLLGNVAWIPAPSSALTGADELADAAACARTRERAECRAAALNLPLVWPERFPGAVPTALRAAAHATEIGAGAAFALAASRLAYCGGFDLEDPEVLTEAAAAAGMALDPCLAAARDPRRDAPLHATARRLRSRGVSRLPASRVGRHWFAGEEQLAGAAALALPGASRSPLAPVG